MTSSGVDTGSIEGAAVKATYSGPWTTERNLAGLPTPIWPFLTTLETRRRESFSTVASVRSATNGRPTARSRSVEMFNADATSATAGRRPKTREAG
jgi:hypothetical protein